MERNPKGSKAQKFNISYLTIKTVALHTLYERFSFLYIVAIVVQSTKTLLNRTAGRLRTASLLSSITYGPVE